MNWKSLTSPEQIDQLIEESQQKPVVIFKHSTSCSISATAKSRIERQWDEAGLTDVAPYYLDLLSFRPISRQIADQFEVRHESPQLLLIKDGQCRYHASHLGINLQAVKKEVVG